MSSKSLVLLLLLTSLVPIAAQANGNFLGWQTNEASVFRVFEVPGTNAPATTNRVFSHFVAESLSHHLWTNLLQMTNGRTLNLFSERTHPEKWPAQPPIVKWATNGLLWGMRGLSALSPCWESEGSSGQVPITALTRRHGYARGHGMGNSGYRTNFFGKKVWFVTTNNKVVEVKIRREIVVTQFPRDYTIVLFDRDLPRGIEPISVVGVTNLFARHPRTAGAPWPILMTEQWGQVSAEIPGFKVHVGKGGDSGSPNLMPFPGELVFYSGRATSGLDAQVQSEMDELCRQERLNPKKYQVRWVDVSKYPVFKR
jgi:hypothetical protein